MYFLYHNTTRPTGRPLAKALQIPCGLNFNRCPAQVKLLVRWGNAIELPRGVSPRLEFNKAEAIKKASNKLSAFSIWNNPNSEVDVKTVEITRDREVACTWLRQGSAVLGRTKFGTRGSGITVYTEDIIPAAHDFYTRYIPDNREYRLHVVRDSVIRIQRKYCERPELIRNPYIKNTSEGYVYKTPRTMLHSSRSTLAVNAVKALGLDFGAVDMVIDCDGVAYVLEVNSAPACSPLTGSAYVAAISNLIYESTEQVVELPLNLGELEALRGD